MGSVRLCTSEIALQGEVILGIHSNVAGDAEDYTAGHAWVSVETGFGTLYLGLWPDGHPRVSDRREECSDVRYNMEAGVTPIVSRFYRLTPSQTIKLNRFVNRPEVWGYFNTCAEWAAKLLNEVVGVPISAIDYMLFSTPRELGRELRKLEAVSPTSPLRPRQGEMPENLGGNSSSSSF